MICRFEFQTPSVRALCWDNFMIIQLEKIRPTNHAKLRQPKLHTRTPTGVVTKNLGPKFTIGERWGWLGGGAPWGSWAHPPSIGFLGFWWRGSHRESGVAAAYLAQATQNCEYRGRGQITDFEGENPGGTGGRCQSSTAKTNKSKNRVGKAYMWEKTCPQIRSLFSPFFSRRVPGVTCITINVFSSHSLDLFNTFSSCCSLRISGNTISGAQRYFSKHFLVIISSCLRQLLLGAQRYFSNHFFLISFSHNRRVRFGYTTILFKSIRRAYKRNFSTSFRKRLWKKV